jgi:(p)ppGpp synthase/HD superfamily hydrolase
VEGMNHIEAFMTIPQIAKLLPIDEVMHTCSVAGKLKDDDKICLVALLHDVVEDKYATFDELSCIKCIKIF